MLSVFVAMRFVLSNCCLCDVTRFNFFCVRHTNEKNFVGLAADSDMLVCGSESNSVYMYYKQLPRPLLLYKFPPQASVCYSVCLSACLPVCLSACLRVCLFVCLFAGMNYL